MELRQVELAAVRAVGALEEHPLSPHPMDLPRPDLDPLMSLQTTL